MATTETKVLLWGAHHTIFGGSTRGRRRKERRSRRLEVMGFELGGEHKEKKTHFPAWMVGALAQCCARRVRGVKGRASVSGDARLREMELSKDVRRDRWKSNMLGQ